MTAIAVDGTFNFYCGAGFVPYKDDKLADEMLKDVSHADVAKSDDPIDDDTDPSYDDYYDVRMRRCLCRPN